MYKKSTNQIKQSIGTKLVSYWNNTRKYAGFSDSEYYLLSVNQVRQYMRNNPIHGANLGQGFDCDDYAFVLKGKLAIDNRDNLRLNASIGIGIAWGCFSWVNTSNIHAVNWFLDTNGQFYWLEPQNGQIYNLNECKIGTLNLLLI